MPGTLKLYTPGTIETRGITHLRYDRAIIRAMYTRDTGLPPGSQLGGQIKTDALNLFISRAGLFHPENRTLPLARVTMRRWGPDKVMIVGEYFRTFQNIPTGSNSFTLASFRGAYRATEWINRPYQNATQTDGSPLPGFVNGVPKGMIEFVGQSPEDGIDDESAIVKTWVWRQVGWRIFVNTILNFNPAGVVALRRNTINAQSVSIGPYSFPAKTVRFDDASITWFSTQQGDRYAVQYAFTTFREGFKVQAARFHEGFWETLTGDEHETNVWSGGFPV